MVKIRKGTIIIPFVLSVIWIFVNIVVGYIQNTVLSLNLSILILAFFLSFNALLTHRTGTTIWFCIMTSLLTNFSLGFSFIITRIPILIVVGLIFELIFLLREKGLFFSVLASNGIAFISIPWVMWLMTKEVSLNLVSIWDFTIIALIIGIVGSLIAYLVWNKLKTSKLFLKIRYSL